MNTVSHYSSFLYLNGRFKTTFAAVFVRFWRSKVFPKPHLVHFHPSKVLPRPRLARFQPSGVPPRLPRSVFGFQKYSRSLARRVFNLREASRDFPGVFSTLKSTPEAFVAVLRTAYRVFFENSRAIFVARRCLATKALSIRFKQKSS